MRQQVQNGDSTFITKVRLPSSMMGDSCIEGRTKKIIFIW